jgi:hypothetical protein
MSLACVVARCRYLAVKSKRQRAEICVLRNICRLSLRRTFQFPEQLAGDSQKSYSPGARPHLTSGD